MQAYESHGGDPKPVNPRHAFAVLFLISLAAMLYFYYLAVVCRQIYIKANLFLPSCCLLTLGGVIDPRNLWLLKKFVPGADEPDVPLRCKVASVALLAYGLAITVYLLFFHYGPPGHGQAFE